MDRRLRVSLAVLVFFSVDPVNPICQAAEAPHDLPAVWKLVWQDEFDGDAVDRAKWFVEDAALDKNNEQQYYSPDEVFLREGHLVLRSRRREKGGHPYTSGLVETKGTFSQTYGLFEVRAKLPRGQGVWPAHWLMPADNRWPPEIDITELLGHEPHTVHMTLHWPGPPMNGTDGTSFTGPDFTQGFHIFSVEWEVHEMRWLIDGKQRYATKEHIPDIPMRIILNTAVGGDWPGEADQTTIFPQEHIIDYVRVYARDNTIGGE